MDIKEFLPSALRDLPAALKRAAEVYDPSRGWNTTAQPQDTASLGLTSKEYCELAEQAIPDLNIRSEDFLTRNNLSFFRISQQTFRDEYEHAETPITFEEFVEAQKARQGITGPMHVMVVGACAKGDERAEGKVAFLPSSEVDRQKDYLRVNYIFLKGSTPKMHRESFVRMGEAISSIELDEQTVARKNQFHTPHAETHYRGHKSIWVCEASPDAPLAGTKILAEVKIEHADQQDVNRLTRRMQEYKRQTEAMQAEFYDRCGYDHPSNYNRFVKPGQDLEDLGRHLYDITHNTSGFLRFLDQSQAHAFKPVSKDHVALDIKRLAHLNVGINNMLATSCLALRGVNLPDFRTPGVP